MNEMSDACCAKEERCLLERLSASLDDADKAGDRLGIVLRRLRGTESRQEPQCCEQPPTPPNGALEHFVQQAERNANNLYSIAREFENLI